MIRLGLTGETLTYHGRCISSVINGAREDIERKGAVFEKRPELADMRIVAVYDAKREDAEKMAQDFGIARVAKSDEELAGMVDGVFITCTSDTLVHYKQAFTFLEKKVPVYVDKPFAATAEEARSVVEAAIRCDTPVLSCSARRYDPLIVGGAIMVSKEIGEVKSAHVFGNWQYGTMIWYGVHAFEVLFAILGPDVVAVHDVGTEKKRLIKLTYRNGLMVMMDLHYQARVGTTAVLFGDGGVRSYCCLSTGRNDIFFTAMIRRFALMIETRKPPFSYAEMVHVIRVINAADQSMKTGREVCVDINDPPIGG